MDEQLETLALADRRDLAPRARQLLAQQLAECDELLAPLLRSALDDLEHELFRIAQQSSGGQAQHEAMEALHHLKGERKAFRPRLMTALGRRFATVGQPEVAAEPVPERARGDLSLVDPDEFSETMALDDLSTRTELHAGNALFDLCHRYAVLLASPPLDHESLPPGPGVLAAVLAEAATTFGLNRDHRLLFYRLCDRRLFSSAEAIYARLNDDLRAAGVLPHLRNYLPRQSRPRPRTGEPDTPQASAEGPPLDAASDPGPMAPATIFTAPPPAAMTELHGLLAARRQALSPAAPAAVAQHAAFASMPELQEALSALQALPSRRTEADGTPHLAEGLMAELQRHAPDGEAPRLQPEHRDAVELIDLLYDRLRGETRTQGIAQQLLTNLQVPLLRVALSDNDFFTVRDHPARRLLNLVLETANLWLDLGGENFDNALHQRLKRSVDRVANEFQGDIGVIRREADELDSHLKLLSRRAEIAERRQVEAAQGRDRLRDARAVANQAIARRLEGKAATPLVRALLENAWADALTLTVLRDGENSEAWRRRLAAVDQLLGTAVGRDNEKLASELVHGLTQVGLQAGEADHIARSALELPPRPSSQAAAAPPSQTELLIHLKSRRKTDSKAPAPAAEPAPEAPLTPDERRALETLTRLSFGSWLEFTVNQQGQKVARKLAWYNPTSGNCLLVNVHGAAAPERTLERIARLMVRGQVRVMPAQDGGMIDRAWNALLAGLRKFARFQPTTVPAT